MSKVFNMVGGGGGVTASIFVTGLSQTDTVTATNGSKTLTGKWTQKPNPLSHGLPDGYTELEYIESTGTQYIDTQIVPTAKYKLEAVFSYVGTHTDESAFGVWDDSGSMFFTFYNNRWYFGDGSGGQSYIPATNVNGEKHVVINNNSNEVVLNGDIVGTLANGVYSNSITLFARKYKGKVESISKLKLKEFICFNKETDSFVCKFVPCKRNSDSAIGLYDLVSGTFFENSGTGAFIAGAEIPQTFDGFLIKSIRDFGTWTVTATDGTDTYTQDVLVDVITEYEIEITKKLYLYRDGDECEDVTGGWNALGSGSSGSLTKNASSFTLVYSSGSNAYDAITKNTVDISNYSKLYIDWIFNPAKGGNARIGIASSVPSGDVGLSKFSIISKSYTGVTELDVSDVSGQYYAVVTVYNESVTVNKIWLE